MGCCGLISGNILVCSISPLTSHSVPFGGNFGSINLNDSHCFTHVDGGAQCAHNTDSQADVTNLHEWHISLRLWELSVLVAPIKCHTGQIQNRIISCSFRSCLPKITLNPIRSDSPVSSTCPTRRMADKRTERSVWDCAIEPLKKAGVAFWYERHVACGSTRH